METWRIRECLNKLQSRAEDLQDDEVAELTEKALNDLSEVENELCLSSEERYGVQ